MSSQGYAKKLSSGVQTLFKVRVYFVNAQKSSCLSVLLKLYFPIAILDRWLMSGDKHSGSLVATLSLSSTCSRQTVISTILNPSETISPFPLMFPFFIHLVAHAM